MIAGILVVSSILIGGYIYVYDEDNDEINRGTTFNDWVAMYGRKYATKEERARRLQIF